MIQSRFHLFLVLIGSTVMGFPTASHAQDDPFSGLFLMNVLEIGVAEQPNHLFLVDAGSGELTELLVENDPIFTPWVGWSPDGTKFAYLAPARSDSNYELWLADAVMGAPVPRTPLFNLDLTVFMADWHPRLNFIGVSTPAGLYVVNANFENVVKLNQAILPRSGILDWSHDGEWLAYSEETGALSVINGDTRTSFALRSFTQPRPALLPNTQTGWSPNDQYYLFSDDIYQNLYAVTTDGQSTPAFFTEEFTANPFTIQVMPNRNELAVLAQTQAYLSNLDEDEQRTLDLNIGYTLDPHFGVTSTGNLLVNSFIPLSDGDFAECLLVNSRSGDIQLLRDQLNGINWAHTRCQLLGQGGYFAMMATDDLIPYDNLPDDQLYDLYIVSANLRESALISNTYLGFETSPLGFDAERGQVVLREGDQLMVYNLEGDSKPLIHLRDLGLRSDTLRFEFLWQPS